MVSAIIRSELRPSPTLTAGVLEWLANELAHVSLAVLCGWEWKNLYAWLNAAVESAPENTNPFITARSLMAALLEAKVVRKVNSW
jgi:hypothetical protein